MPFWKRKKAIASAAADLQEWSMSVVEMDDSMVMIRLLQNAKRGREHLRYQVGVATSLREPNALGFHDADEGAQLGDVEDALIAALEQDNKCAFVFSNCGDGTKEWVFYTSDPDYVKQAFSKVFEETSSHSLQLMIKDDPDWSTYDAFAQLGEEN